MQYNLSLNGQVIEVACASFAAPRIGNKYFKDSYERRIKKSIHVVNLSDIVPALPPEGIWYNRTLSTVKVGTRWLIWKTLKEHLIDAYEDRILKELGQDL